MKAPGQYRPAIGQRHVRHVYARRERNPIVEQIASLDNGGSQQPALAELGRQLGGEVVRSRRDVAD